MSQAWDICEEIIMEMDVEIKNLINVPVKLNDEGPFTFHLDIGAGYIIASEILSERLGLQTHKEDKSKARSAGGSMEVKTANLEKFSIGPEMVTNEKIAVIDLSKMQRHCSTRAEGVVGHNFLKNYVLSINYPQSKLKLEKLTNSNSVRPFSYIKDTHIVTLEAKVNDKGLFTFILDTGASGSVINQDLVKIMGLEQEKSDIVVMGPGGPIDSYLTSVSRIETEFKSLINQKLSVIPLNHLKRGDERLLGGILGYDFLKNTELIIDYPNEKLGIIPFN